MPWIPEQFTAPAAEHVKEEARRRRQTALPYFEGLLTGDVQALVGSFAAAPELHHPTRGRVKGTRAFARFMADQRTWLLEHDAEIEHVGLVITPRRGVEEVVLHLQGDEGRVALPVAIASDRRDDGRLNELRMYFSSWPITGAHAIRPPLLQPDPDLEEADVVGEYQRALAAGDVEAIVACFEPDGVVREPAGGTFAHRDADARRALYTRFFSNGGGIALEHCSATDDGRTCALEYNVVQWGRTPMAPQAGIAVYVRGERGRLAGARIYDDCDPPLTAPG